MERQMVKAFIPNSFWHNPALIDQPHPVKLTLLWIISNIDTRENMTGMFSLCPKKFSFDCGLEPNWLHDTIAALPDWFIVEGDKCLYKHFIAEQFGTGKALESSKCAIAIRRRLATQPKAFQKAILALHPELKPMPCPCHAHTKGSQTHSTPALPLPSGREPLPSGREPLPSGREPLPSGGEPNPSGGEPNPSGGAGIGKGIGKGIGIGIGIGIGEGECEGGNGVTRLIIALPSTVEEVIAYGKTIGKTEECCRDFWAHYEGQARLGPNGEKYWVTSGGVTVTNWPAKLSGFGGLRREETKKTASKNAAAELDSIRCELQWQTDPARVKELRKRRDELM